MAVVAVVAVAAVVACSGQSMKYQVLILADLAAVVVVVVVVVVVAASCFPSQHLGISKWMTLLAKQITSPLLRNR